MRTSYNTDNTAVGTEPAYNKYGTDGYGRPNSGYRNDEYPTTGVTTGRTKGYQATTSTLTEYPRTGATGTYDTGYPTTGTHDSGYRTADTTGTYHSTYSRPGEIPAREYPNNSVPGNF